ncbi:MAG: tetratricopeptide repeat protein, partial [Alphaproteobacteria bacterium]
LLENAGGKGRILYITDAPKTWKGRYPFAVLDLNNRSADDSDIQHLLTTTQRGESTQRENAFSGNADVWADLGGWVVLFFLPFFALLFRKGVLFLIFFLFAIEGEAGFLWRADQEIYHTQKKGVEAYQNREYQSASRLFQQAGHLYNLGNALAFSGDIQGAIEAYQKELEKNPDNQDALFNKEYLEKQLPPPEEPQKQSEEGESKDNKSNTNEDSDKNQQGNRQQESEQQSEAENQADKNQTPENNEQGTHQSDTQPTQDETQEELEKALAEYEKEAPYNQEEQQIINRLNHDPSRVLRYRLMLQHQKGQRK